MAAVSVGWLQPFCIIAAEVFAASPPLFHTFQFKSPLSFFVYFAAVRGPLESFRS